VASLVPLEFWYKARAAAAAINPAMIWLAESVHPDWVVERRENGLFALSDSELFRVFDITYDYDIFRPWERVVKGDLDARYYLDLLSLQDAIYPEDYVKLRFVENHDTDRVLEIALTYEQALAWIALQAFNKGAWLIYAGQESAASHKPSHFEKDVIPWGDYSLTDFIRKLAVLKKDTAVKNGNLSWLTCDPLIQAVWQAPSNNLAGIFNTSGVEGEIPTMFPDGTYQDLITGEDFIIKDQRLLAPRTVFIFYCPQVNTQFERETVLI